MNKRSKFNFSKFFEDFSFYAFILFLSFIILRLCLKIKVFVSAHNYEHLYLILIFFLGLALSKGMVRFLNEKFFEYKFFILLGLLLLAFFHPKDLIADKKLMWANFLMAGLLAPIFVEEIKKSLNFKKRRLDTILAIVTIITLPLAAGILKKVQSDNETIKNETRLNIAIYTSERQWKEDDPPERFLSTEEFVRNIPLCKAHVECRELESEQSETLDNIYNEFVNETLWVSRAKAAYLLRFATNEKIKKTNDKEGNITWEKILDALVNTMTNKRENLVVKKTALDSFRYLIPDFQGISSAPTRDNPDTVFDFGKAEKYWQDQSNKTKIIEYLKTKQ